MSMQGISSYPVDSPLGSIVLEVGLFGVAVGEGFLRFDESMHVVDAIDLRVGVGVLVWSAQSFQREKDPSKVCSILLRPCHDCRGIVRSWTRVVS